VCAAVWIVFSCSSSLYQMRCSLGAPLCIVLFSTSTVLRGLGFSTSQEVYASGTSMADIVLAIVYNSTRNGVGPPLIQKNSIL
jgi:hypothetical protein